MDSTLKPMPAGPPPLPRENVIQAFERVYDAWRKDVDAGCPVDDPTEYIMVPIPKQDAIKLIDALEKLERRSNVAGLADTEALAWRVKLMVASSYHGQRATKEPTK